MAPAKKRKLTHRRIITMPLRVGRHAVRRVTERKPLPARDIHASVLKNIKGHAGKAPSIEAVNAVALDLVAIYAKQAGVGKLHMPRIKKLAKLQMNPHMEIVKRNARIHRTLGQRKLIEELSRMGDNAMRQATDNRLAKEYHTKTLANAAPMKGKEADKKVHPVPKTFAAELVKRAAQVAAITITDLNSSLRFRIRG